MHTYTPVFFREFGALRHNKACTAKFISKSKFFIISKLSIFLSFPYFWEAPHDACGAGGFDYLYILSLRNDFPFAITSPPAVDRHPSLVAAG